MYRHDYILRIIERFGRALTALRDRILRRTAESAMTVAEIQEIAEAAGLDLGIARSLDPGLLLMWLAPSGQPDPGRLWLMSELLYLEGLRAQAEGDATWRGDFQRSLTILESLAPDWRPADGLASAGERAQEIRSSLGSADGVAEP